MPDCRACCKCFTVSLVPVTVFSLAVLFFFGIILLPILYEELSYREQYGVVIDAGSTHSQVYLYAWEVDSNSLPKDTRRVYQKENCRTGGGISDYTYKPGILDELYNCTNAIIGKIPDADLQSETPVWLGATAGMRLVGLENATLEEEILSEVTTALKNATGNNHSVSVRVLSGKEEASSGWLTANYLNFNFSESYPKNKRDAAGVTTVGAMDMGGASMQIAFQPPPGTDIPASYLSKATIFNDSYSTYARSYLCFGVNEANRRLHAYLAKDQHYNQTVNNPCLLEGRNVVLNASILFDNHTCTQGLSTDAFHPDFNFTFVGTGNSSECSQAVSRALNFSWCVGNECGGNGTQPSISGATFYAFSNFYYIANFTNVSAVDVSTIDGFNESITKFCNLSWQQAQDRYSETTSNEYLEQYCFRGVYILYVLQDGFGFNKSSSGWNIRFVDQIDSIDVGWSLGYMLNQTNQIAPSSNYYTSRPYLCVDLVVGMIILSILCVVFVVFFLFTFSACRKALRPSLTGYTHIS